MTKINNHFRLKTKTESKTAAKMNTGLTKLHQFSPAFFDPVASAVFVWPLRALPVKISCLQEKALVMSLKTLEQRFSKCEARLPGGSPESFRGGAA